MLLLSERIDEWVMGQLETFEGKRFKDAARGDLELGALASEADKARHDAELKESKGLLKRIKDALGERVTEVRVSDAPEGFPGAAWCSASTISATACGASWPPPARSPRGEARSRGQRDAPAREVSRRRSPRRAQFGELAQLLYEQAPLAEGAALANPPDFVLRLNRLLVRLAAPKGQSPSA